jgi:hypothetical protein
VSQIPASMEFAIPNRTKTLNVLETLVIGTAGGALFLWANLPGGRADFRRHDRGGHRCDRRTAAHHAADPDPDGAGAARDFAGLAGVAATPATYGRLSLDHCAAGAGDVLLDIRQQHLSAAHPRLGPDLGISGRKPRRTVADHHARRRERRRCAGDRRGADHARDHAHRGTAAAAGADRNSPIVAADRSNGHRFAARTDRADCRVGGGSAAAAADKISGKLDVRRDDRVKRIAWHRTDRGRPAAMGARSGAGRHRARGSRG